MWNGRNSKKSNEKKEGNECVVEKNLKKLDKINK
jgi:hypothetical protein